MILQGQVGDAQILSLHRNNGRRSVRIGVLGIGSLFWIHHRAIARDDTGQLPPVYRTITEIDLFIAIQSDSIDRRPLADLYPQLSQEFIVDADPDLIFLACTIYCGETADSVGARDGWAAMSAVANGNVIEMNDDIASRWGPRSVDYLEQVVAAVTDLATAGAN